MNQLGSEVLLLNSLSNQNDVHAIPFSYRSLFLSSITPDETNARYLPSVLIDDEHAKLFIKRKISKKQLANMYHAEDHVMIGKSCMINCLKYDTPNWRKANHTIQSILELGNNISVSELIQVPTIYPIEDSKFKVLTGHRRFFALIYANGYGSAAEFKVYESMPLLSKVKQFQENASRAELPQYGKLIAFESAMMEIETLSTAKLKIGLKKLTVKETATNLGISMGAFDNYNVLTRYSSVIDAYEAGLSSPFVKTKKIILDVESKYKSKNNKTVLNISDKKNISTEIEDRLLNKQTFPPTKTSFQLKTKSFSQTIKALLTSNIIELDTGINWNDIDWENHATVSKTLSTVIDYLEEEQSIQDG